MKTRIYTAEEQTIFRGILEKEGLEKEISLKSLIQTGLDKEDFVIGWLKRNNNYHHYMKLKNEMVGSVIIINPEGYKDDD